MKKLYLLFFAFCFGFSLSAQIVNIPDAAFKDKLLEADVVNGIAKDSSDNSIKIDSNNDGEIQDSEALLVYKLYLVNNTISDLTGIVSFQNLQLLSILVNSITSLNLNGLTNLQDLDCGYNNISTLDVSGLLNLKKLKCESNQMSTLNVSGLTNLLDLDCSYNFLPTLNVSGLTNLLNFNFSNNLLPTLNVSGLTNLEYLNCASNQLSSLNVNGMNSLQKLECGNNLLPTLNVNGLTNLLNFDCSNNLLPTLNVNGLTNLEYLNCINNQLSSLNVNGMNSLQNLECGGNLLTTLNVSNLQNLYRVNCEDNQISSLDTSGSSNLVDLICGYNLLSTLDFSGLSSLESLDCEHNQFQTLDFTSVGLVSLERLDCSFNQLTVLNVNSLTNMVGLNCGFNLLSSLNIGDLINLEGLDCSNNAIPVLDFSGITSLIFLQCQNNLLQTVDITGQTQANNQRYFDFSNNQLSTLFLKNGKYENFLLFSGNPNLEYICADDVELYHVQIRIDNYGYSNCHVNSYCSFQPGGTYYIIQGNTRFDENTNGCDTSDITYPSLKLAITDGTLNGNNIANTSGNYEISVPAGTYTFTPILENPAYFSISPTTATVTFPTTASPFTQDFCVTANGIHNDLEVTVLQINGARPGFDAYYKIIYKNKGNQTQSGAVTLDFEDAKMDLVSATPINTGSSVNTLNWSFANLQPFESREILVVMNINSPTETPAVNSGDVLYFTAAVAGATDESPTDNTSVINQSVVNSLDPNVKVCLEGIMVSPAQVGKYVHYFIHFENTGTANATNIVVKDIIDTAKYDINSLVPLNGSASYVTRLSSPNQVEFIFQNINLPFNDVTNDGYVSFKIKTKSTLVIGDTFSNNANIYFDYNPAIVTNTAITIVSALGIKDFDFNSMFTLSPVPAGNILTLTNKQGIVISSASIYNTLGQLIQVSTNPNETIDVSGLKAGTYFIKVISDKGTASSKFIKE